MSENTTSAKSNGTEASIPTVTVAPTGYRVSIVPGALEVSARLVTPEEARNAGSDSKPTRGDHNGNRTRHRFEATAYYYDGIKLFELCENYIVPSAPPSNETEWNNLVKISKCQNYVVGVVDRFELWPMPRAVSPD
jgi:hypothetical protein